ncbi:MAG: hypothetical protein O3C40_15030 [Planctomycetota bacterium]|nr:hypothetical protein [Planctomycetota bacterium]
MKLTDLTEQIDIEFEAIQLTVDELASLRDDVSAREPTVRELAAAGLFLANFYNGIENVLKRICRFHEVEILAGSDWHVALAQAFGDPPRVGLPPLLDAQLADALAPFRQFRHVVHHGYGFRLRWCDMLVGVEGTGDIFARFKAAVERHLHETHSESEGPA